MSIIIPDSDLFPPNTHLNSQGSIQRMLPLYFYRRKALPKHVAIASCPVLIFMDESTSRHMTVLQLSEIRTVIGSDDMVTPMTVFK